MTELLGEIARTSAESATVTFERGYRTDPADLWDAVTSAERLTRWFAPVIGDLRDGGEFTIHFDDGDIPRCRVVRCDAPRSFAWEWPYADSEASLVEVSVAAGPEGSILSLTHSRLPSDRAPEYGAGWQAYVQSLTTHVAGGGSSDWWADFGAAKDGYTAALGQA